MPRVKEPVDLLLAKGRTHLTKADIERRRTEEIKVPFTDVKAPKYLTGKNKTKFNEIAGHLVALGIMTELDTDCLAMYVLAHDLYIKYTEMLAAANKEGDIEKVRTCQNLQDKAFKQCQSCAREMGLTITARAKIVMPDQSEEDEEL